MNKFKSYIKRIIKLINLEEMKTLPGHLAFNIVLMIYCQKPQPDCKYPFRMPIFEKPTF